MKRVFYFFMAAILLIGIMPSQTTGVQACSMSIVVTNTGDSGPGSLRQAISDVCAGGTITFSTDLSGQTITLVSGELTIPKNLTIDGSTLAEKISISGNNQNRVFTVNSDITAVLDSFIIKDGFAFGDTFFDKFGGGIFNGGNLHLSKILLTSCEAELTGGGIFNIVEGTLTVIDSTIADNSAEHGGGIYTEGNLTFSRSTMVGNNSLVLGGGILILTSSAVITNSTFSQNHAGFSGSAIFSVGQLTIYNSTFTGNTGSHTLVNEQTTAKLRIANTIISTPSNLLYGCALFNNSEVLEEKNNLIKISNCGEQNSDDPLLEPLAENGGPTQTIALLPGSPAIDAGDADICAGVLVGGVDQRGALRNVGAACDIGAFEFGGVVNKTLVVNATDDVDDGNCDQTHCSLREAVLYANSGDTIEFDLNLPNVIELNSNIVISKDLTIIGPGSDQLAISGSRLELDDDFVPTDDGGVFKLLALWSPELGRYQPVFVTITGLTIKDGRAWQGGGVLNYYHCTLVLEDCVIGPNNVVTEAGGGIANVGGNLTMNRCSVVGNHGTGVIGGAGIFNYNGGEATLINSTVTGNVTNNDGGGILAFYGGTVNLVHSTVTGNIANDDFDIAPYGGGGGIYITGGTVTIKNSIVAGNIDKSSDNIRPDVSGNFLSVGGNLIGDSSGSSGWVVDDLVGSVGEPIDTVLDSLALNEPGTTPTHALLQGSPALNAVACAEGVAVDQRGVTRPQGFACDMGAFELESTETYGELKISKAFAAGDSGFTGTFAINYDCITSPAVYGTVHLAAGSSQTISNIPTGAECIVEEPFLPTPPVGWSFGTPTYNPANGAVIIGDTPVEVIVTNTITRTTGSIKFIKSFDPLTSGFTGTFDINFTCTNGDSGTVPLAAGGTLTLPGLPLGTVCTVTEPTLPIPPAGWSFGIPTYSPADGTVTIGVDTVEVTVTNTISMSLNRIYLPLILFSATP